jgi:tRNA(adenine34) deaminase
MVTDQDLMQLAISHALRRGHHFGAAIVRRGRVISLQGKRPRGNPTLHAESTAIIQACKKLTTQSLHGCTLYTTSEPCLMCFYLAWVTRVSRIVYGATIRDAARAGHPQIAISVNALNNRSGSRITIVSGVLKQECVALLQRKAKSRQRKMGAILRRDT